MSQENPVAVRYLSALEGGLTDLEPADRAEVVRDIRSHISESLLAGKPLDQVLASLGAPDALARAYTVELLMKRPGALMSRRSRLLRLVGLVVVGSIPTLVVAVVLGVVGIAFSLTGIALFAAGQMALNDTLPWWITMDADPRLAVALGPVMSLLGVMCLTGLWFYFRFATRLVTRVLPPRT